ncbi:anti-sigma factor family protein [Roseovarius rhodophyticola]|uniref:DUF465 domain-containing protein n=1 Tax=Roseovarius rhodophyticola TaxID=3080827 RepID=A0ABZ2TD20_9RHOB|nr:hypothetical protein [Roseovarius sp. W115]MDV2930862.1 hypothetical protein [Roseovarius sp. W115]
MTKIENDDQLHRFIDGECSPSEELEILRAEHDDDVLAKRIRKLRGQKAELRAAMELELAGELPLNLVEATKSPPPKT